MRDPSISYLKAIGITLMVMAHYHCPIICREAISLFHMPLFFLASGYCFKEEYIYDISKFITKRIKKDFGGHMLNG